MKLEKLLYTVLAKQDLRCFLENFDAESMTNAIHETRTLVVNLARKVAQKVYRMIFEMHHACTVCIFEVSQNSW